MGSGASAVAAGGVGPATAALKDLSKLSGMAPAALLALSVAELEQLVVLNCITKRALTRRAEAIGIGEAALRKADKSQTAQGEMLALILAAAKGEGAGPHSAGLSTAGSSHPKKKRCSAAVPPPLP